MKDGEAGYAIVEVLASLVIVGMISIMMISGVTTGERVWERMDANDAAGESIAGAQLMLRERIERLFPATLNDVMPPYSDFDGASDQISFLSEPKDSERPSALDRYRLTLSTNGDLILTAVNDTSDNQAIPDETYVLLHGVQDLDIAYYGPGPNGQIDWQPGWRHQQSPPELVRIRVQLEQGDKRVWPDLLISPMVSIDSLCILNAATGHCRGRQ
jgi:general secretion pathway protein J